MKYFIAALTTLVLLIGCDRPRSEDPHPPGPKSQTGKTLQKVRELSSVEMERDGRVRQQLDAMDNDNNPEKRR